MATHSSVLAWRIPGTGEPGGLPSVGLHRVGRTQLKRLSSSSSRVAIEERNGNAVHYSCLENLMDRGT